MLLASVLAGTTWAYTEGFFPEIPIPKKTLWECQYGPIHATLNVGGDLHVGTTPLDFVDDTLVIKPTLTFVYNQKPFPWGPYNIPGFTMSTGLQGGMSIPFVGDSVLEPVTLHPIVIDY